ncbi:MAG: efflux transporter outer membrane subunit [Muribaculaceae bacterium]|nr:efflux transporter outer membrane subunit [Muribaculaceae bacterium]
MKSPKVLYTYLMFATSGVVTSAAYAQSPLTADSLPASYQEYHDELKVTEAEKADDCSEWWRDFGDANLNSLEELAIKNNYNLKAALKRIDASREMLRGVYAGYSPVINLQAGYEYSKDSGRESKPYTSISPSSFFNVGASMSWEIDVFGRIREKAKSSKINIDISKLDYDSFILSLTAEVANDYGALCLYYQQLKVAKAHLKSQIELLDMIKSRYEAGLVSKLDVAQAENTVNSTRLRIPVLEAQQETMKNALALLCGSTPEEVVSLLTAESQPTLQMPGMIGKPADLLRQRPDLLKAERQIDAIAANLGIAKKDYLPSLTLDASIGTSAHNIGDLFGKQSLNYSVTPTLTWTLFEGLARRSNIAEIRAEMEAEIETYNNTVLTAINEVDNAIINYNKAIEELSLYDQVLATSREMLILSIERYKLGLVAFSDVATAQTTYLTYQTSLLTARNGCYNSIVSLYKAIGGGYKQ